jgi:hypothetical protein
MTKERKWPTGLLIGGLLFGGIVIPLAGWLICIALFWAQKRWSLRQKLLATFAVPGGLLPAVLVIVLEAQPARATGVVLLLILTALPLCTAISLWAALFSPGSVRVSTVSMTAVVAALAVVVIVASAGVHTGGHVMRLGPTPTSALPTHPS